MEISENLIQRYFLQECTPGERAVVSAYFDEHPEQLDHYLSDQDWADFEPDAALHPALSNQMLNHIEGHILHDVVETRPNLFQIKKIAAAAAILITIGLAVWVNLKSNTANKALPAMAKNKSAIPNNDTISNTSAQARIIELQDGSEVTLSPQSEIVFSKPFVQPRRDIHLKGEAIFKVAKDKTRPFTVYAAGLSTTALGTRFKVSAFADAVKVSVMLYTGKVVIKHYNTPAKQASGNDVYLIPGQQLVMDKIDEVVKVSDFNNENPATDLAVEKGRTQISHDNIRFQNEALQEVINVLQDAYHITIQADEQTLAKRYYTGTVNTHADLPENVLQTLAKLNNLVLTKQQHHTYKLTR